MKIELLDGVIAFQRSFIKPAGGVKAALLMSQIVYWNNRTNDKEGWFYKKADDFEVETGLSRKEQEQARRLLVSKDWLETKLRGVPPTLYFRVGQGFFDWMQSLSNFALRGKLNWPSGGNQIGPPGEIKLALRGKSNWPSGGNHLRDYITEYNKYFPPYPPRGV
jgi:hypothetical protein